MASFFGGGSILGTSIDSSEIADGSIVNADVNASAAIAYSKLNLATSIVNADVSASAAIAYSKLNLGSSIANTDLATTVITGLTADATPAPDADYLLTYDASATALKKVLLTNACRMAAFSITRDLTTATGTQAVTGVGFKPKLLIDVSTGIVSTGANFYSFDGHGVVGTNACTSVIAGGNSFGQGAFTGVVGTSGTAFQTFVVTSLDADGFTLTWTKTSTPTGTGQVSGIAIG